MLCKHCSREITNKGSLVSHEMVCRLNPNRTSHKRSSESGAQKGTVPWNKGQIVGRSKHWDKKYPLDKILVENSTYPRHCLKKRVINSGLIPYRCACCEIGPVWNGKPMPLILDHVNGVSNDNRIENLRFVCSNCDSQLDTYKSRNRKSRKVGRVD